MKVRLSVYYSSVLILFASQFVIPNVHIVCAIGLLALALNYFVFRMTEPVE